MVYGRDLRSWCIVVVHAISSIVKSLHLNLPFCYLSGLALTEHLDKCCLGRLSVGKLDSCMLPVVKLCIRRLSVGEPCPCRPSVVYSYVSEWQVSSLRLWSISLWSVSQWSISLWSIGL